MLTGVQNDGKLDNTLLVSGENAEEGVTRDQQSLPTLQSADDNEDEGGDETTVTRQAAKDVSFSLLEGLPGELRNKVYDYVALDHVYYLWAGKQRSPAIFVANKEIWRECRPFFSLNTVALVFRVPHPPPTQPFHLLLS